MSPAGAGLAGPLGLTALAVLVVNDHVLKPALGNWWTGKLSDVAALVVAPLAAQAAWELAGAALRRYHRPSALALRAGALATGSLLIAIKLSRAANEVYEAALGAAQWLPAAAAAVLLGSPTPPLWTVESISDPTDLLALPALALPLLSAAATGWPQRRTWRATTFSSRPTRPGSGPGT